MSNFVQLRELKIQQDQAIREYWRDVQGTAGVIRQGFADYLQLPDETYVVDGGEVPYVKIAKRENGKHKEVMLHELDGENSWLDFSIGLTVDRARNTYPKNTIYTNLKLKKIDDGYQVTFSDHGVTLDVNGVDGQVDFSAVYDQIFKGLQAYLSYRP